MAIPSSINDREHQKFIESTDVAGKPGIVVLNPDGSAVGAPVGGATSANQTNGSQKTQIVDAGGEGATVTGGKLDVNATIAGDALPIAGATDAVGVAIVDGSGNQITSFGGGTQYTEGDTDASITGTAMLWEDSGDTLRAVSAAKPLPVGDAGGSLTVDINGTAVSSTNPIPVMGVAIQDTGNSTSATLGSGGNFTGTAFDLNNYASWSVNIFSDKASSTNGLVVQWSDDATNWDFSDAVTYVASVGNMITFGRKARYVRLNYTNTNSAQTIFRVVAYAQPVAVRQTRKFVGNQLSDGETAQVVIAGIQGHTTAGGGAWVDVKVNPSGALTVDATATDLDIRNLAPATDTVAIGDGTDTLTLFGEGDAGTNKGIVVMGDGGGSGFANIQTDGNGNVKVVGVTEHDSIDNVDSAPLKIGGKASTSEPAAVANADRVNAYFDATGYQYVKLGAGTAGIGKLTANSGVDIGDVDVASIAAGDNNIGNVDIVTMPNVTNGGTFAVQESGAALTALQLIDDTIKTLGTDTYTETSTKGSLIGAVRRDANTSLVDTTNEVAPLQVNATGELKVAQIQPLPAGTNAIGKLSANSGVDIGDVDVTTVGTITPGTAATSLGKAEDVGHSSGDVGVFSLGVANEAQTTLAADGDYIAMATDVKGNGIVVGNIAHDTADAGNPVKMGAKAVSAEITPVTANDRTNLITDLVGKLITLPYANPENFVSGAITSAMTGTTSTSLVASPGAGLRNYITQITVSNAHATVGTDVIIQDGSGGTTLYTIPAAFGYGGATITFPVPLRQPTTATALYCANVTTGASTKVSASGYKGA